MVARVNDKVITWGEIEMAMEKLNFSEEEKFRRGQEFVEGKVDRLLSQVAFKKKGGELPESYIEQEYSSRLLTNFNGDRRLFREVLQSQGQSPLVYKDQLKEDIIHMHMLSQRKRTGDEISPQRVESYYHEHPEKFRTPKKLKLREIVFSEIEDGSNQTLEQLASHVHSLIVTGEAFEELAAKHGQSPFTSKGGDWGVFVTRDEIRNVKIQEVAFSLKENEVSHPFEVNLLKKREDGSIGYSGESAWYILKADKIQPAKQLPVDEVRPEIEKIIANNFELDEQRKWLSRQKRDAYVDVRLPSK